jgi:nucleoside-diphosphate-sugar epimerase
MVRTVESWSRVIEDARSDADVAEAVLASLTGYLPKAMQENDVRSLLNLFEALRQYHPKPPEAHLATIEDVRRPRNDL